MLENILGGLFDKEKATYETVQGTLEKVSEELAAQEEGPDFDSEVPIRTSYKDFFIMIRPMDDKFNHKYFICKYDAKGNPVKVREISLKEILEIEE